MTDTTSTIIGEYQIAELGNYNINDNTDEYKSTWKQRIDRMDTRRLPKIVKTNHI